MSEQNADVDNSDIIVKVVSPEGHLHIISVPPDTAVETVKNEALKYFYPGTENLLNRFKLIQISETHTLTDSLTLLQEHIVDQEELLLVERHAPEAGMLWDLGTLRGPSPVAIVTATSTLPVAVPIPPQPDLQSLLSTNEITNELRKILISLIEIGARLAAASRNYKEILESLSEQFKTISDDDDVVAANNAPVSTTSTEIPYTVKNTYIKNDFTNNRADELRKFLDKFRIWRRNLIPDSTTEDLKTLKELGFDDKNASEALKHTGHNTPAAVMWLLGERGPSLMELVNGLPDGTILRALLTQPVIQRGLLNTRMLLAFITMVGQSGSANLWLNAPHGGPLLSQILRTYHAEKYCLAVNQFSNNRSVIP